MPPQSNQVQQAGKQAVNQIKKKMAILGGSFDPPTISHLQVAAETINLLGFDEVRIVPCGARPDKQNHSTPQQRLQMVQLAVRDFFPATFPVVVDPIEVDNGPTIPTVMLLDQLQLKYKETHSVHFVMGSDLIKSLHLWQDGQRMIQEMPLVVFRRKGCDEELRELESHPNFPKNNPMLVGDDKSMIGVISSTEVRRRIGQSNQIQRPFFGVAGLVTQSILGYIASEGLYHSPSETQTPPQQSLSKAAELQKSHLLHSTTYADPTVTTRQ